MMTLQKKWKIQLTLQNGREIKMFKKTQIKKFEKGLIQYGLKHNYIEKTKEGLKFVGNKNKKQEQKKEYKNGTK